MNKESEPFRRNNIVFLLLILCLLAWTNAALVASDSKSENSSSPTLSPGSAHWDALLFSRQMLGEVPVVTDFDGDHKADIAKARLVGNQYQIIVHLSSRSEAITLDPLVQLAGFKLLACDINEDSFQDLIVTTPSSRHPLAVWLGDGEGGFRAADQKRFRCQFEFAASPRYNRCSFPAQQDLLTESFHPVGEKPGLALTNARLEPNGFISCNIVVRSLRSEHFSLTPRSPPVVVPS